MLVDAGTEYEVERVLDSRVVRGNKQFLVKWKGYNDFDNTWVMETNLENA